MWPARQVIRLRHSSIADCFGFQLREASDLSGGKSPASIDEQFILTLWFACASILGGEALSSRQRSNSSMMLALLSALLLISRLVGSRAASILGFSLVGSTSHQAPLGRIGLELTQRGHKFTVLLSSQDELSHSRLAYDPFGGLNVLNFSGPARNGTQQWRAGIPRATGKARSLSKTRIMIFGCPGFCRQQKRWLETQRCAENQG